MTKSELPILRVEDLSISFQSGKSAATAVAGITFEVYRGEMLAIVGESGCGKSVTAMSVLGLLPTPPAIVTGQIIFEGRDLLQMSKAEMLDVRGKSISMIFQQPMTSLNPVLTIERQLTEGLMRHEGLSRKDAIERAKENLDLVGIPESRERLKQYPHQLSGGMRQRVMIAMAISCNPKVLIADEPTTALDVTIQAQILELATDIQNKIVLATILITHDLGVVAETADRVAVMYFGRIVEQAPTKALFENPKHPYTIGLMGAVPRLDLIVDGAPVPDCLAEIKGMVPSIFDDVIGCPFTARCPMAQSRCFQHEPPVVEVSPGHTVSCWELTS